MILYISKTSDTLNKVELKTEFISDYICINPKYSSVTIKNKNAKLLMDSGAFQDTEKHSRISLEDALKRQLKLENKIGITSQRIVPYDMIGNTSETLFANNHFANRRKELFPRQLVLMLQGPTIEDYVECLVQTLKMATPGDCIGLGGVALAGRNTEMKEKILDLLKYCLPLICKKGIRDIHIFGVGTIDVLKRVRGVINILEGISIPKNYFNISCDTSSYEIRSTMGNVLDPITGKWKKVYGKTEKFNEYQPADLARDNMRTAMKLISEI